MTLIADQTRLLADTGPFCRLAEAGETQFDVGILYLRPNTNVVMDVRREIRRRSTFPIHARLTRLALLDMPVGEPITITDRAILKRIDEIIEGRRRTHPGHEDEDRGEVATALIAKSLGLPALMDDGFGKNFATNEGVQVFTTRDLAVELAAVETLKPLHAWGIYRIVYQGAKRQEFDRHVSALKATLGQP